MNPTVATHRRYLEAHGHRSPWARWLLAVLAVAFLGVGVAGCGYSEEEMRAKLRQIDALKKQLDAEEARNKQFQRDLDDARAKNEQLKEQLSSMGVDFASMKKDLEEQAKALAEYKRRAQQLEAIKDRFELLRSKLQTLMQLGLKVEIRNNRMVIQLPGDVLFDSGRETLRQKGKDILKEVAAVIRADATLASRDYQVAGHTDNKPFKGAFKDNWGLSVMRAREVLAFLVDPKQGGLDPKHWSAAGYGDTDPLTTNDTPEGNQANRRCELVVVPAIEEMISLETLTSDQ
jgi:chemotaxis protein MotB